MSVGHLYVPFGKMSIQVLCPLFKIVCVLGVELYEFFKIKFGYQPLIRCIIDKYVLPSSRLSFHFTAASLYCAKSFQCDIILFAYLFFLFPLPKEVYQKKYCYEKCQIFLLPMFTSKSFTVLRLTFKSLIHVELILVFGVRRWSSFIFACICPISSTSFIEQTVFTPLFILASSQILIVNLGVGLFLGDIGCLLSYN